MMVGLNACCALYTEDGLWFVQGLSPILNYYDWKRKKVIKSVAIKDGNLQGTAYYSDMFLFDDEIILIPNNSDKIMRYDVINDSFVSINLGVKPVNAYKNCYRVNDILYCMPYRSNNIILYD